MARKGGTSEKFWNKIANKYANLAISDEAAYKKKLDITQSYFSNNMEILELGCGTGSTAIAHAPHVKHITAVDISENMLAIAKQKATKNNIDNISFKYSAIEQLESKPQAYDVVLALSLLHLLEDKDTAIKKIFAMLKPGGLFISSTTCLGDNMKYIGLIAPVGRLFGFMPLIKIFTVSELIEAITASGFKIETQWQPGKNKAAFIVARKPTHQTT
ncbi:MAG: class I SAM-dependent methyltransferase [Agarilytica sp.]